MEAHGFRPPERNWRFEFFLLPPPLLAHCFSQPRLLPSSSPPSAACRNHTRSRACRVYQRLGKMEKKKKNKLRQWVISQCLNARRRSGGGLKDPRKIAAMEKKKQVRGGEIKGTCASSPVEREEGWGAAIRKGKKIFKKYGDKLLEGSYVSLRPSSTKRNSFVLSSIFDFLGLILRVMEGALHLCYLDIFLLRPGDSALLIALGLHHVKFENTRTHIPKSILLLLPLISGLLAQFFFWGGKGEKGVASSKWPVQSAGASFE